MGSSENPTRGRKRRPNEARRLTPEQVFGERLRHERKKQGMSKAELSRRMADAGRRVSRQAIIDIEQASGARRIRLDEAIAFAYCLNVAAFSFLDPSDQDDLVSVADHRHWTGTQLRNFFVVGDPHLLSEAGKDAARRTRFPYEVAYLRRAINEAGGDQERRDYIQELQSLTEINLQEIGPESVAQRRFRREAAQLDGPDKCRVRRCYQRITHQVFRHTGKPRDSWGFYVCTKHADWWRAWNDPFVTVRPGTPRDPLWRHSAGPAP